MRPLLFWLSTIAVPSYFVLLVLAFLLGTAATTATARREGQNPDVMVDTAIAMLFAGVLGARLFSVLFDGHLSEYVNLCINPARVDLHVSRAVCASEAYQGQWDGQACHPAQADCFAALKFWTGGLTYYGGLIGATAVAIPLLARDRFSFWKAADYASIGIAIGLAVGRMGCLLAGCCFGAPCTLPWAVSFPPGSAASEAQFQGHLLASTSLPSLPVHPTQIYESIGCFAIACTLWLFLLPRKRYNGELFLACLALYAILRFGLEFARADDRGGVLWLSTSQWVGVVLFGGACALHRKQIKQIA
jgi:phosphatidylglycerol:prolipoprotein diacylglycerol transferase